MAVRNYYSPFSLRSSEEVIEKMKYIARAHKRSATKEIELVLEQYIAEFEKAQGEIALAEDLTAPK